MSIKRPHLGFTLIEVVLAVSVLLIVGQFILQGETSILKRSKQPIPEVEWYLMLHELENPEHEFILEPGPRWVTVYSKKTQFRFSLSKQHDLRLSGLAGGYIILMTNVESYQLDKALNLSVKTLKGQEFKSRLLLPKVKSS
ncbi:prepilin-type cleavage/methylation domain-containing protein [Lactobacillus sp.] [Lactiplantibacillus mudanjiangensis]|uniref:prepilin-type N-terminal cleavage/methylation domain-containing protein n=1 Tax=Lactiplantibacillus mudanjiangensis TaxID=1296538 RepID=UPI001014DAFD|nr:prepilin-type N-terminal cleavage/methylation domain-containing protein [Lactiplantibacillus mudanjiangensis]VDG19257.1 prepilin-type cleavage/methylation domain-containing protein [Lactobacillus sp.] [Lactiplantibacillus mudanjiangensis]VDG31436.1 prepilin-type cleavage/methylation domain-containing protein [Lactobacillus sp.] [Lactiplantibacillus mudanjiangensis]